MSSHAAHISLDVAGRLAQGGAVVGGILDGILDGIAQAREEQLDAVSALVAELGRARRRAASAEAEAARLRRENASLVEAVGQGAVRADHAEAALRRLAMAARRHLDCA